MDALSTLGWLGLDELRIGLGCMRMSTDEARSEERSLETIAAAVEAGMTVFDTAHAYGHGAADMGHNERLLARALRRSGAGRNARIVTKGGMTRIDGGWIPDGRAKAIRADCEASLDALDGLAIDLYLVHAPDPRTPWRTTVRELGRLLDEGVVRRVGLSNVTRGQLDEALDLVEVSAVEIALSALDDSAVRGGIVERCTDRGIAVIAHSPLGGPRRAKTLARQQVLVDIAAARGATPSEIALAWLLDVSPAVVAIPGARRPETARSAARAAGPGLEASDRAALDGAFGWSRPTRAGVPRRSEDGADVVMVMGIPGAGKSRFAATYIEDGYDRLNRDERGGSLRRLNDALEQALASGVRKMVLDNTYLTRATRSHVIQSASRHQASARCIWIDTPLAQAQMNMVERILDRFGSLPAPDELQNLSRHEPGILVPTRQMRALRELEPPTSDEGFVHVERVAFVRSPRTTTSPDDGFPGVFVAAAALQVPSWQQAVARAAPDAPYLVFDWQPAGTVDALDGCVAVLTREVSGPVVGALCGHPGGPPVCWCRPPLPGLPLALARAHGVDPSRSFLVGSGPSHRTLATTLGAIYLPV